MSGEHDVRPWGSYTVLEHRPGGRPGHEVKRMGVPVGSAYRIANPGPGAFGEDDVERLEDDTGRVG